MTQNVVVKMAVDCLRDAGIPHMVTGSVASNYYGEYRSTVDTDIVIDPTPESLAEFVRILPDAFYISEDAAREALRLRRMFNIIHGSTGHKVDLIIRKNDAYSVAAFQRRGPGVAGNVPVEIVAAEDLILSKLLWARRSGSERQVRDASSVLETQSSNLDLDYLKHWAAELDLEEELQRLLDETPEAN